MLGEFHNVKTAIIIQARMGSTRLPGKVLMRLGQTTILGEVIRRCKAIPFADVVCCAIPFGSVDDQLAIAARNLGAIVSRGDEVDVLSRYSTAAQEVNADVVMRITADKPFIDPQICGKVLRLLIENNADFASNNMPAGWPHGLDCEAFTSAVLYKADKVTSSKEDREHVTPWMRRNTNLKILSLKGPGGSCVDWRWTLDYKEDYEFISTLFERLDAPPALPLFKDILSVLESHPEFLEINSKWVYMSRYANLSSSRIE